MIEIDVSWRRTAFSREKGGPSRKHIRAPQKNLPACKSRPARSRFFYKNNPARPGFIFSSHPHSRLLRTKIDIYYVFGILMRQPAGRAESLCNNYINDGIFFLRADKGNTHSKQRDKIRTMAIPGFFVLSGRLIS
ncbi:hypothetical protein [Bordetella trematum]|uniref:hypothetical protein n=1 Tax=Bordetella trematum TaxID=123899 RepID=UPI0018D4C070|nr:hypothetical protein [Bordetella trematum]